MQIKLEKNAILVPVAGLIASFMWCLSAGPALGGIDVLVKTGDPAPDGNGTFAGFGNPSLNNSGEVAFFGTFSDTTSGEADSIGLYRGDASGIAQIERTGSVFQDETIIGFFPTSFYIDASGAIVGTLVTGPPTAFSIVRDDGESLINLVERQSPSPSGNNELVGVLSQAVNDNGDMVFRALYSGMNEESGIYTRAFDGTVRTLLLRGSQAPRGGVFDNTGGSFTLNENTQVATVTTVDAGGDSIESLVRLHATGVEEILREGDLLADGITTIESFGFNAPLINNQGAIAFSADYEQPGRSRDAVFVADSSGATLVADGLLPGSSVTARDFEVFGFTDSGQVAFSAEVGVGFDPPSAIYSANTTDVTLIAIDNAPAPGTGKLFDGFPFSAYSSNNNGEIVFLADLADSEDGPATGRALFRMTDSNGLSSIVQTGDELLGSTIADIFYAGTIPNSASNRPDESLNGMNESGQVAFTFVLADDRIGVALWSPDNVAGDFDGNQLVNGADFITWQRGGSPNPFRSEDLAAWQSNYGVRGETTSAARGVVAPEPTAQVLLAAIAIAAVCWGRERNAGHRKRRNKPAWSRE